jgi:S-adenosylmethionine synthetase
MIGYACDETPQLMPLAITLCNEILEKLSRARKSGEMPYLKPDARIEVTVRYEYGKPCAAHMIMVYTQHDETIDKQKIQVAIEDQIVSPVLEKYFKTGAAMILVNPGGTYNLKNSMQMHTEELRPMGVPDFRGRTLQTWIVRELTWRDLLPNISWQQDWHRNALCN